MKLQIEHISKQFKQKKAVHDVTLVLEEGIHALLGANGSGKTTLMRMICGVMRPSEGEVLLNDINILDDYASFTKQLGYLPQEPGYYMDFTVEEFLNYISVLKCLKHDYAKQKIDELLQRLHLSDVRKKKIRALSGGTKQRVGIAQSLLNHPKLLILDEPSSGLDPKERMVLRQLIAQLAKDTIVILSTHIVSDVEHIADDIIIMKQGSILSYLPLAETLELLEHRVWEVSVSNEDYKDLCKHGSVLNYSYEDQLIRAHFISDTGYKDAIQVKPTLDDVYLFYFEEECDHVEADLL